MYIKSAKDLDVYADRRFLWKGMPTAYEQAMVVLLTTGHRQRVIPQEFLRNEITHSKQKET